MLSGKIRVRIGVRMLSIATFISTGECSALRRVPGNRLGNPVSRVCYLDDQHWIMYCRESPDCPPLKSGGAEIQQLPAMAVRILIADDDASIRRLLRRLIESHDGWSVCGDAQDGQDAIGKAAQLNPDVIVLDLAMPQMNGLQAAREISRQTPEIPLLLLTVQHVSKELTNEALHAGFKGAISKSTGSEVVKAIEVLLQHQHFFQPVRSDAFAW